MKVEWQKVLVKTAIWLAVELVLNLLGLDSLADYSEFITNKQEVAALSELAQQPTVMILSH